MWTIEEPANKPEGATQPYQGDLNMGPGYLPQWQRSEGPMHHSCVVALPRHHDFTASQVEFMQRAVIAKYKGTWYAHDWNPYSQHRVIAEGRTIVECAKAAAAAFGILKFEE